MKNRLLWAALAATLAVAAGGVRFLALAGFTNDHYMHLAKAQQMVFGEWPSRDFVDHGMPLMIALSAAVLEMAPQAPLFGEALLVASMFGASAVVLLYAARRLTGSLALALLAVLIEIAIFPRSYSYPKVLAYAIGFAAMWRYVDKPTLFRMFQLAVVVVLAFLLRYDHGIYLGVGGLLTVCLTAPRETAHSVTRAAATYVLLTTIVLLPYLIYVQYYDGLWHHVTRGVELQAFENARGRRFPVFGLEADGRANAVAWLYFLFHLLPIAAAIVAVGRWRIARDRREMAMAVPLIVVAVLANFGLIRETLSARLPDAVVPACLLLIWLLARAREIRRVPARTLTWVAAAMLVMTTAASVAAIGSVKERLERAELLHGLPRLLRHISDRSAQLRERLPLTQIPSRATYALLPFFAYADRCLQPSDHIFVPEFFPEAFIWARRPFAGGQAWFQSGMLTTERDRDLVMERLAAQRVPVIVMLPSSAPIVAQTDALSHYVAQHFTDEVTLMSTDGPVRLGFDPRLAVGRDRETGWYCYR